jgi:predicted metalloprotease
VLICIAVLVVGIPVIGVLVSSGNEATPRPTSSATATTTLPPPADSPTPPTDDSYTPGSPDLDPPHPQYPNPYDSNVANAALGRPSLDTQPLFAQALPTTQCQLDDIDFAQAAIPEIEQQMAQVVVCLMYSWHGVLVDSGFQLPHPLVTIYSGEISTPCGISPTGNAFFCTANQQLYVSEELTRSLASYFRGSRFVVELVIAHEFGHFVQYRSMILKANYYLKAIASADGDDPLAFETNRRFELQADCFAGLFIRSVSVSAGFTPAELETIVQVMTLGRDKVPYEGEHGVTESRMYWLSQGLGASTVRTCDTFNAPGDQTK